MAKKGTKGMCNRLDKGFTRETKARLSQYLFAVCFYDHSPVCLLRSFYKQVYRIGLSLRVQMNLRLLKK